jgi:hypothetical protein
MVAMAATPVCLAKLHRVEEAEDHPWLPMTMAVQAEMVVVVPLPQVPQVELLHKVMLAATACLVMLVVEADLVK